MGFLSNLRGSPAMTPAAAADASASGILLVDVRESHEYAAGHGPHARHIPLGELPDHLEQLAATGRPVAFICRSGTRSALAARRARSAGVDAHNVSGGMMAWQRQQLPVATGTSRRPRR